MEITYNKVYTRKIDREYNEILFKGCETSWDTSWKTNININPINIQKANDYLVTAMTNLKDNQVDELDINEYDKILKTIRELKLPSSK